MAVQGSPEPQPGPLDAATAKTALRRELLAARRGRVLAGEASALAEQLQLLLTRIGLAHPVRLAGFLPTDGEPDPTGCMLLALRRGADVVVPRTMPGQRLEWVRWRPGVALQPDRHGLLAPAGEALPGALEGPGVLVLVPALAADRAGTRLGYGAGYYDRALAPLPRWPDGPFRTAVVHLDGLLDVALPRQPHDEAVDALLTAAEWVQCPSELPT